MFFFKRYLFTYLFFIWKGYSSHSANLLGNLSCSRNISAVSRNADGICVSNKMFGCCSVKGKKKSVFYYNSLFFLYIYIFVLKRNLENGT